MHAVTGVGVLVCLCVRVQARHRGTRAPVLTQVSLANENVLICCHAPSPLGKGADQSRRTMQPGHHPERADDRVCAREVNQSPVWDAQNLRPSPHSTACATRLTLMRDTQVLLPRNGPSSRARAHSQVPHVQV